MTMMLPALHLTTVDTEETVRIEITGDLDYDTAELLLDEVTAQLGARPRSKDLHLHCAGIGTIDSMGLSILLMIGRRTAAAGVRLHLDDRPATLDRLLEITGTLDHFTTMAPSNAATGPHNTAEPPTMGKTQTGRPTGPDGTT
ncbi:STAS domain-containing protein [Streptomyces sp. NPDC127066]|uniref:STAS domain-containing protein n=1 Tax=Streptomyces sp. NPDC127066 TaxID=3347125 RepID=UPI0036470319